MDVAKTMENIFAEGLPAVNPLFNGVASERDSRQLEINLNASARSDAGIDVSQSESEIRQMLADRTSELQYLRCQLLQDQQITKRLLNRMDEQILRKVSFGSRRS